MGRRVLPGRLESNPRYIRVFSSSVNDCRKWLQTAADRIYIPSDLIGMALGRKSVLVNFSFRICILRLQGNSRYSQRLLANFQIMKFCKASRKATYSYISNRYYYIIQTTYYVTNIYELKNIDAVVIYE